MIIGGMRAPLARSALADSAASAGEVTILVMSLGVRRRGWWCERDQAASAAPACDRRPATDFARCAKCAPEGQRLCAESARFWRGLMAPPRGNLGRDVHF